MVALRESRKGRVMGRPVVAALAAAVLIVAALALGGCSLGGSTTTTVAVTTTVAPTTTSTEPESTTIPISTATLRFGDKGTWQGISVTAVAPETDTTPVSVGAGDRVVYCMVTIVNNSKDPLDYNGLDFQLFDADKQEYDNTALPSVADLGEGTVAPGETAEGAVAFELPVAARIDSLEWLPGGVDTPVFVWQQ